ncbi:ROK family protein [Glaciibacter psychrotolerans]|uniref:Glucokinase n=1 Tax=Glaciibacter psychrotolerans TaxID=670054 RepID=A0A7Z0EEG7_9MICO|nr:ROK family protein [Leifsonia psychrotolerans]NYJ19720.1 glucokinase [Leifsonia psychrotolerans]
MTGLNLGIDIGGTKIAAATIDEWGEVVGAVLRAATPAEAGPDSILATVVEMVQALQRRGEPVSSIGIGSAGTIGSDGTVTHATDILPAWTGTRISDCIAASTGLPVTTLNDVHAAGYGEARAGAACGVQSALVVAVGTGVSGALISCGTLVLGRTGSAGSIGHIPLGRGDRLCSCGAAGHVEAYASGPAMERAHRNGGGHSVGLREIAAAARSGDAHAITTIRDGANALGHALATGSALIDPDIIILCGGVVDIGDLYLDSVRASFRAYAMMGLAETAIVPARLGTTATMVGAALYARSLGV